VFHREAFAPISAEKKYYTFFFVFIYKKGELSSISSDPTYLSLEKLKNMLYISISPLRTKNDNERAF